MSCLRQTSDLIEFLLKFGGVLRAQVDAILAQGREIGVTFLLDTSNNRPGDVLHSVKDYSH